MLRKNIQKMFLLIGVGVFTFFNSIFNPFINDDYPQIVLNPFVRKLANLPFFFYTGIGFPQNIKGFRLFEGFFRPIPIAVYTLLFSFFGQNPFPFHMVQIFIHIANTILVFYIFALFFESSTALFLSLIFLVHPINSESVIYISNLQEVLFSLFGLLSLALLIKFKENALHAKKHVLIFFLLFFSLLSKETGFLFLFIILIYSFLFDRKSLSGLLFVDLMTFSSYLVLRAISSFNPIQVVIPSFIQRSPLLFRLISIPRIILYYISQFIFPVQQTIGQEWLVKAIDMQNFYLPLFLDIVIFAGIVFFGIRLFGKKSVLAKPYIFFSIWFGIGLLMHIQLLPLDFIVASRWFYFPIIGALGMMGIAIDSFFNSNKIIFIGASIIVGLLMIGTIMRNTLWQSPLELYAHDIKYMEESPKLYNLYGEALVNEGELNEAKKYFKRSLTLDPLLGSNLYDLGIVYEKKKDYSHAKDMYWKSIYLNDGLPKFSSYEGLVRITLFGDKNPEEAKRLAEHALKIHPLDSRLRGYLAISQYLIGDKDGAISSGLQLLKQEPSEENKALFMQIKDRTLRF